MVHLGFALDKDLTHQHLESLGQGCAQDVALELVELTGREEAARRHEHLVQLIHYRGFADNDLRRVWRLALTGQLGRYPEAGEPDVAGVVDQHIPRRNVLMYEAVLMDLADC
jgi:hypothetical protein